MSGPASFRLSRETRDLLKQHQDFFSSVLDLYDGKGENPQKTPLKFKPADAEARTEAEVKPNGDVEVTFIVPLDDNEKAGDGRVYLKDKFVFDPTQKVLKGYKRSFEHNGQGDPNAWKGWLGKYEALLKDGPGLGDKRVQSFGLSVARTFGQNVVDEKGQTLEKFREAFKREHRYLDEVDSLIQEQAKRSGLEGLRLRIKDKESSYQVLRNGDRIDLIFKWMVDGDGESENGRVWLKDRFTFSSGKFVNLSRDWAVDPKSEASPNYAAMVEGLKRQPAPNTAETKAFGENIFPNLVPQKAPDPQDLTPLIAASMKGPAGESVFKARSQGGPALDAAQKQVLQILEILAKENVANRADHAQGLLNFESKVDVNTELGQVESLFKKLAAARDNAPAANLKVLLQGLELSPEEGAQRQRLLNSTVFRELISLAQEKDVELRHSGLLHLAESRLFMERGYPGTAMAIADLLKEDPNLGAKAGKFLDLANGKGSFGSKVEMTLGHFNKEMTKPSMLVGMMAAPFAGAAFEAGGLRLAKYLYDAKKIQSIGTGVKLGASGLGIAGESLAFTGMHRGYERLWHGSEKAWTGAGDEILSSMLLFVGMRATHGGTAWASSRAAEGKLNFKVRGREVRFGGREGTAAHGPNLFQATPTGRMLMGNPWVPEAGIGAPTLTKLGQFSAGASNHLGGIFAMQASGWASRQLGIAPDNGQGFGANFFDATVMYGQAMIGFNLANRATMGRLQPALGEVKMRIQGFDAKAGYTPIVPESKGGQFEFGPWLQQIVAKRSAAKPKPAAPEPAAKGSLRSRVRESLGSVGEWFSNWAPSKVKNLESKLAEVEAKKSAAETDVATKGKEIAGLEAKVTELTGERDTARSEAVGHKTVAEEKATRLSQIETELGEKRAEAEAKGRALSETQEQLATAEAKRQAAEGKLQAIEENAEAADLGLSFATPSAEIEGLRQKIQVLSAEKSQAEVRAATLGQEAAELRGNIETAKKELQRREGIDQALREATDKAGHLETAKTELENQIAELRRDIASKNSENHAASELVGQMGQRISDLEKAIEVKETVLEKAAGEIKRLRGEVESTAREAQLLADRLRDSDVALGTANHQLEIEAGRVEALKQAQAALEREKGELQAQLADKNADVTELNEKLTANQKTLAEVKQELNGAKLALETAESVKKGQKEENGRLREAFSEAQTKHTKEAEKLSSSIRDLEGQVKAQQRQIDEGLAVAEELRGKLSQETSRADVAEARGNELQGKYEELQAQHEQTKKDLDKATQLLHLAESKVTSQERQLEREKKAKESLVSNLDALRTRKKALDGEIIEIKAEKSRLETRLEDTERQLEELRNEGPVVDIEAQVELQEAQETFAREKSQFETRIREMESTQAQLKEKTESLEREKSAVERRVRGLETDLEMAKGAAESRAQDLEELQTRSRQEADGLRSTLETWRQRATDAESGKAKAESRAGSLEGELGRTKARLESVEGDLRAQSESLKAEQAKTKELEAQLDTLSGERQLLQSQLEAKEGEIASAKTEAQDKIDTLTRERDTHAGHLREKSELAERLKHEIAEKRDAVSAAERLAREAKDETRKEQNRLGDEKRTVQRELEAKARELTSAQASVGELRTQVAELENRISEVRRESEANQDRLASEKRDIEGDLQTRDQELTEARTQLAESDAKVAELEGLLDAANVALDGERTTLTNLRAELEEAKIRNEATVGRLREEARRAGEAKEAAEGRAREANAKVNQLETAIEQARSKADEEVRAAQGKVAGAEQKTEHAEELAAGRLRELEDLRSKTAAEAEKLRNEALAAARKEALATTRAEELEQKARVAEQQAQTVQAQLRVAEAQIEALQAPASQHSEAQAKATRLSGELAAEKQKLIAAEAKAEASASRVASLESDLAAQRATNSQEALRHQAEAELHENKALAAEQRASAAEARALAAEERVTAAEAKAEAERSRAEAAELRKQEAESRANAAELEARRVKAAADQASGVSGEVLRQRDLRIQGLQGDLNAANADNIAKDKAAAAYEATTKEKIAGLEAKARTAEQKAEEAEARAQAAESRAAAAEGRATEAENSVRDLEEQVIQMAHSLSSAKEGEAAAKAEAANLLGQKTELQKKIGQLEQTIGALEQKVLEKIAERQKAEGEAAGAQSRVGELEKKIQEHEAEIERLQGEIQNVWAQGQNAGKESIDQKGAIDRLKDEIEVLKEDLRVASDAQHTVELLAESERKLTAQVRALTRERNEAQLRVSELEREIAQEAPGIDPEISLAAYNLRSAGAGEGFFQQVDPRQNKVSITVKDSVVLRRADGMPVGEAKIVAGGAQGDLVLEFLDGTNVSARTTMAGRRYQEDGVYLSRFSLPDGREVKILTGSDGAGGHKSGDLASSTFLQGVHARAVEAAQEGRIPTAGELFEQGEQALWRQKEHHASPDNGDGKNQDPTGTGSVIVMVGDEATIATKGDSNVLWARPHADGQFEVLGLSETDAIFDTPANLAARKYNVIIRGVGMGIESGDLGRGPRLYGVRGIRQGDRFLMGSDGFWGVMVGPDLVEATSSQLRQLPRNWPEASQDTFEVVRWALRASAGQVERAEAWHDLALQQMKNPAAEKTFFGQRRNIDFHDRPDNIFAIDLEQGLVTPNAQSIIPDGYGTLWPVLSLAETRQRAALAGDATQPKIPSPVPPPLPSSRTKTAIQSQFSGKYVDALVEVYGTVFEGGSVRLSNPANEAARQFVELYLRYPELEHQINPALLQAADRVGQIKIFEAAEKFLQDIQVNEPAKVHAAKGILKNLKELRKVFPKASPEEVGQVRTAYQTTLQRLFGAESNKAAQIFANLHKAAPDSSSLFTPDTLGSPAMFNRAYFYREISEKIAASGQPYQAPTQKEMAEVLIKYQGDLERVFGPAGAPLAAEWFAGLYKTVPALKGQYTPEKLQVKKFNQQLIRFFNIDSVKMTDSTAGTDEGPIGYAADIKNLSEAVQPNRAARGWASPESLETGVRVWNLIPGTAYEGGRREGAIILDDGTVSSRHFKIRSHGKEWLLEEIQATNGVFVNGKVLKSGKTHSLKDGDKLRFGHLELQWNVTPENQGRLSDLAPQAPQVEAAPPQPQPSAAQAKPAERPPASAAPNSSGGLVFNVSTGTPFILGHEQIPDYGISSEHLQIERVNNKWFVQDRGSIYGTRLNGTDIQAEMGPRGGRPPGKKFELNPNDELKVGNILLRWNGNGQLVQSGGSIQPPSTRLYRPSPGFAAQELKRGETRALLNSQQHQIGAIQWDPSQNQFLLRNSVPNPQLWVQAQGQTYPLNEYCILTDGTVFGIGPNPRDAQYFLFRNNVIIAVQPQAARSHSPAAGIQAPLHIQYEVTDPLGIRLGRQQFRNHPSISGEHLDFRRLANGQWEVRDAASLNGMYLNGEKISTGTPEKGDPRVQGEWKPLKSGDILSAGVFNLRFHAEGHTFSLDELPYSSSEAPRSGPIPSEGYPNAFRPSPSSGYREAQADMAHATQGRYPISLGDSRTLLVTKKSGDPGLYYSNPDQPLNGEYYLNLGGGMLKLFDKDLFSLERLEGERYRLTNIGAKNSLVIRNGRSERKVGAGGVDEQVVAGETILLDNGKIKIELSK